MYATSENSQIQYPSFIIQTTQNTYECYENKWFYMKYIGKMAETESLLSTCCILDIIWKFNTILSLYLYFHRGILPPCMYVFWVVWIPCINLFITYFARTDNMLLPRKQITCHSVISIKYVIISKYLLYYIIEYFVWMNLVLFNFK
jgi:hypothetical protein